jgi:hypothetical protein
VLQVNDAARCGHLIEYTLPLREAVMPRTGFVTRFLKPCAVAAFMTILAACGGGGGGGGGEPVRTVTTVTVSSPTATPKQGDTVQLTAVARDQFGDVMPGTTASWSSSAPAVATVSATGLLQALAGGSVTVTATINGVPGSLPLTITPRVTTMVTVSSPTASPSVGETVQLTVVARDQFGDVLAGKTATWSTSDATVATISPTGLLQAVAPGTVVATATIDGMPGSLALTVVPAAAASVTVSSPTATPLAGTTVQLTAVVRDRYGNLLPGATVAWSTSDARIATISTSGLMQALTPGSVVITASTGGVSVSLPVTVEPGAVASVTVSAPTLTPKEGDAVQLTAVARDQFGNIIPGTTATWSSSDMSVATVSTTGLVRTISTGAVVVTASVGGVAGTQSLTITPIMVSVAVTVGAKEVVFRYATDRCDDLDTPDHPPRLVRAEDGSLVLVAGNAPRNYLSRGAAFSSLRRDCRQPALASADRRTAESYENWEWLWSVYREGSRLHALIHNEFHDAVSSTCLVGNPSPANPCGYVSITHALSIDGGRSFTKPSAPAHVVAPAPTVWVPPAQAGTAVGSGYMSPTNIVRTSDGYYYALMELFPDVPQPDGRSLCVMRTDTLDDPASWRAWDGSGFGLRMTSPYVTGNPAPWCRFLNTEMGTGHVIYSTYLERYLLVTRAQQWIDGRNVCGFFFTLSSDLIHWSRPQLLVEGKLWEWGGCDGDLQGLGVLEDVAIWYPSVVDHADATANFERAGRTAHLYYVRMRDVFDRDVVRVPITFTRVD